MGHTNRARRAGAKKSGSRIGRPMHQTQLQEIRIKRRHRAVERAAQPLDRAPAPPTDRFAFRRVLQQFADLLDQMTDILHLLAPRAASRAA